MDTYKDIENKEERAKAIVHDALKGRREPMAFCSFGKDSLVMVHMVQQFYPELPVVYLMDGATPNRHVFAFQTAAKMGLTLHSYPPSFADHYQKDPDSVVDIFHYFYINGKDWYMMVSGSRPPVNGEEYKCAVLDLIDMPTVEKYDFRWDCIFHGHKEIDFSHFGIRNCVTSPIVKYGHGVLAMPLYDWSDAEVWAYMKKYDLPYQEDRYQDNPSGRTTGDNRDNNNPDVIPTCYKCLDLKNRDKEIFCPRKGGPIKYMGKTQEEHRALMQGFLDRAPYMKVLEQEG